MIFKVKEEEAGKGNGEGAAGEVGVKPGKFGVTETKRKERSLSERWI